ncbi:MAG TPA: hypothetical protein VF584_26840 [Longimicrobium sp.]|jgi:hypothetical protein
MNLRSTLTAAGLLVTATAAPINAQHAQSPRAGPTIVELRRQEEMARRVPVTIALVDQLPAGTGNAPAVVLRRANTAPHDVILLRRSDATGPQLAGAILHLMIMRERSGDTANADAMFRLPTATRGPKAWERTEQVQTGRIVAQLRSAEVQDVPGVGRVRAKAVYLPSKVMRDNARRRGRR